MTHVLSSAQVAGPASKQLTQGFSRLAAGVNRVMSYLSASAAAKKTGDPGFYVSQDAVGNPDIQQAMNVYISPDGHTATFNIILNVDPYSEAALNQFQSITTAAGVALRSSPVDSGTVFATGTTPTQEAVNRLAGQDFTQTVALVLLAIFILLVLMLRSIITPLYVILSLAGTYFVTARLVQAITLHVLHKPGISWTVPFFMFLLLVALGVDYSIFLMSRFGEELGRGVSPQEAIQTAMASMQNVIFSAALIMAVTFGSMLVTGVSSLMELALAMMLGLVLYTVLFLGLFVPACVSVFGMAHFWPFYEKGHDNARPLG
jgi:RND superfamily putative drug exporter